MIESLQMYLSQHAVAELSLVVVIVVICAALARALKQPLLIGYILAGIIASPAPKNSKKWLWWAQKAALY